ncbi:hypothetical protein ACQZ4Y_19870 [Rhizobium sp. L80/93]|uniref:hypothetical protein n=1 Tax=unclassified Rhizobium TaxID=2613769 RepID=UPI001AD9D7CB|nr:MULTISPECIES: hypothetical protein [unclassified Rhizobium]MBO9136971.1 hypothetical protein [Rhizobium sp. B209b/85]MBO9188044.1 hypothetical protein [Rhizobium sp. E27B/91]QXZ99056.1 hypothetical protein J5289_21395 [Rhizobium sp. B230/85]
MRSLLNHTFLIACVFSAAGSAVVPNVAQADSLRKASQAQIEAYVAKKADLTKLSNGWSYKSNAKYGYKFSDGGMCVRTQRGSVSCTKIVTDGKKFFMVSPDGTKTPFSSAG